MNHADYQAAASHWQERDAQAARAPRDVVLAAVEEFLAAHNTCALATGCGDFVRCTPIEYIWRDGAFWMFSEGGRKFVGLEENKNVSLTIFDPFTGFGSLHSLQVMGVAEIVEPFSEEYARAAEARGIALDGLKKLPFVMHLIKITPTEMDFLNADFKKDGYDSRQHLEQ